MYTHVNVVPEQICFLRIYWLSHSLLYSQFVTHSPTMNMEAASFFMRLVTTIKTIVYRNP